MVKITRNQTRYTSRKGGGKPPLFTLRNTIVSLVAIQGFLFLGRNTNTTGSNSNISNNNNSNEGAPPRPASLEQKLADSVSDGSAGRVRGMNSNNNHNNNQQAQQNAAVSRNEALEEQGEDAPATDDPKKEAAGTGSPADKNEDTNAPQADGDGESGDEKAPQVDGDGEGGDQKAPAEVVAGNDAQPISAGGEGLNPIVVDKKGTGPTNVGYVKDFVDERKNPAYRNLVTPVTDPSPTVAKLVHEQSVIACDDASTGTTNPKCLDSDTPLIAYNSQSFPRTWCGQEIPPKSAVVMTTHCTDPIAHLFPQQVPPVTGEHMPPIVIKSSADKPKLGDDDVEKVECNIPCQKETGLQLTDGTDSFIDGETWKITTIENERNNVKLERTEFMNDHYFSTQSLWSAIPLSKFDQTTNSLHNRPAVDFDTVKDKAIYLVETQCSSETKRNRWFDAVQEKMTVDSYGHCGHNIEVPEGMTISTPTGRIELMKQYRVVLAFEESKTKDHITKIAWEALASGAVPVIVGAENIKDRLPPNSFINVNNYNNWGELGDYVKKVVSDKELWQSYHKWRDDEKAIAAFEQQYGFTTEGPTCRMCRWAYAKKYGLGWDHTNQVVRSIPKVPKDKFCATADHALVSKPFSEQWVATKQSGDDGGVQHTLEEDSEGESCSSLETDGDIVVGSFKGHRKVYQHDGVTDFVITEWTTNTERDDGDEETTTLRLTFPGVRNPDGGCFYNTHTLVSTTTGSKISSASIQDDLVKVTILANWDTTIKSSGEGIMDVSIGSEATKDGSASRRVRVIIEEMNAVHDKMTEFYPSSYCKLMTKDFIDPVGVFFVDTR